MVGQRGGGWVIPFLFLGFVVALATLKGRFFVRYLVETKVPATIKTGGKVLTS